MNSNVDHPKHYADHPSGVECIDIAEHLPFNLGNALKYVWRAGKKDPEKRLEDLEKALWYVNRQIRSDQTMYGYDNVQYGSTATARFFVQKVVETEKAGLLADMLKTINRPVDMRAFLEAALDRPTSR